MKLVTKISAQLHQNPTRMSKFHTGPKGRKPLTRSETHQYIHIYIYTHTYTQIYKNIMQSRIRTLRVCRSIPHIHIAQNAKLRRQLQALGNCHYVVVGAASAVASRCMKEGRVQGSLARIVRLLEKLVTRSRGKRTSLMMQERM